MNITKGKIQMQNFLLRVRMFLLKMSFDILILKYTAENRLASLKRKMTLK